MKIPKKGASFGDDFPPGPSGAITAANYLDRCRAYIRAAGGEGYVLRVAAEPQWMAWMAYFGRKGIPHAFTLGYGLATTPCEWPEDFDYDAPISDRGARTSRPPREAVSNEQWEAVRLGLNALARKLNGAATPKAKLFQLASLAQPLAAERLAEIAATPVTLSAEALSTEACKPLPRAAE